MEDLAMLTKRFWLACVAVACLALVCADAQASMLHVSFEGPGYVAGELPPSPWWQEYGNVYHSVAAGAGFNGTQALAIPKDTSWPGVTFDLPTPLTSEMGPVSVSILFQPAGGQHPMANFMSFGGMHVGRGDKRFDSGVYKGLIFRKVSGSNGIYGPGGASVYGTHISGFAVNEWYELTYEINAAWDTLTLKAGPVGGAMASMTTSWDGGDITRVWLVGTQDGGPAIFDDLAVVPEPASLSLLALGGLAMVCRRQR